MKTPRYIRNKKGQPIGVLVAVEDEVNFAIGCSLCAVSRGDKFDKKLGKEIATIRAKDMLEQEMVRSIPKSVEEEYDKFVDECCRYYKGDRNPLLFD